ncbi:MAG: hypothetical protein WBG46_04175 [Nonlabens sp.]
MNNQKYIQDLQEIRSLMSKSTRFISLSGMSGVMAGLYALLGGCAGFFILKRAKRLGQYETLKELTTTPFEQNPSLQIILVAFMVLLLSIVTAYFLTKSKAKKYRQSIWNAQSIRLVKHFVLHLTIGGLFTLVLIQYDLIGLVAPAMLIFYGLACIQAAPYTLGTVRYLGISCALLGLINTQFIGYGLYFWTAGFGLCHIIYGAVMHFKYDRN